MKPDFTRMAIILDRSGSMQPLVEATVAGFNEFIRSQAQVPGTATVKLVQFDDQYDVVFDHPLAQVPQLTAATFVPRGSTALLDAQGRTIVELGQELAALPEHERPDKVLVLTITDGQENASKHFNLHQVGELIRRQRDLYNWHFVYMGANQDAVATAAAMNIPAGSAITFSPSPAAMQGTMRSAGAMFSRSRAGQPATFTDEEREAALDPATSPPPENLVKPRGPVRRA